MKLKFITKKLLFIFPLCISFVGIFLIANSPKWGVTPYVQGIAFVLAFGGMIGLLNKNLNLKLSTILILSLLARLSFIGYQMSDDVARYMWEGHIQQQGFNPYVLSPDSPELKHLIDENWQEINHKDFSAIYPPLAQLAFKAVAIFYPNFEVWRFVLIAFDMLSLVMLALITKHYNWPMQNLILYGLNPFVLIFGVGEAHIDLLMFSFLISATYFYLKSKHSAFWISLILGGTIKYFCWFLIPLFINKKNVKTLPYALVGLIPFYFYPLEGIFKSLMAFAKDFSFNSPLHLISINFGIPYSFFMILFVLLFILYMLFQHHIIKNIAAISLMLIVFLPTIHPWYLIMSVGYFALVPRLSFLALQLSMAMGLLPFYYDYLNTKNWDFDPRYMLIIWGIPLTLWFFERLNPHWRWPNAFKQGDTKNYSLEKLSVLIPLYNEEKRIPLFLKNVYECLEGQNAEVIFIDGGSKDKTIQAINNFLDDHSYDLNTVETQVLKSLKSGRGHQLNHGLKQAKGNWICVLHADTQLPKEIFVQIKSILLDRPEVVGGACTMEFIRAQELNSAALKFTQRPLNFIRGLNSFRNRVLGISFGDQLQFFKRTDALNKESIPDIPLMEDVGLAMNMKLAGQTIHLPFVVKVSDRRWQKVNRFANAFLIIKMTTLYLLFKRIDLFPKDPNWFLNQYYSKK